MDDKANKRGVQRLIRAFGWSLQGLRSTFQNELAFRQEAWLLLLLVPLGSLLGKTLLEWALLLGSLFIVLIVELINSAIESVVERVGSEQHSLSGRAKDQGSAAVLSALVLA